MTLRTLTRTALTYYRRLKMIPQAISDAMSGAVASAQALPGKVPGSGAVVLTANEAASIATAFGTIKTATDAAAAALDALNPPAPPTTGSETPVGP